MNILEKLHENNQKSIKNPLPIWQGIFINTNLIRNNSSDGFEN